MRSAALLPLLALGASIAIALGQAAPAPPPPATTTAAPSPTPLTSGWVLLKEGQAEGAFEADAKHPTNPNPHLLKISVTKYPDIGKGRLGAKNTNPLLVKDGATYEITFNGAKEGSTSYGVGLVFSLETDDGNVLARTTLPEIGRGGGARRGAPANAWPSYIVSLHARASVPNAHLTITAIEPYPVWLDNIVIVERPSSQ
jgi:hypothetical protein